MVKYLHFFRATEANLWKEFFSSAGWPGWHNLRDFCGAEFKTIFFCPICFLLHAHVKDKSLTSTITMFTCWWIWVPLFFSPRFPSSGRFPPDRGRQCIGMNGSKSGFCFGNTISRSRSRDLKLWISIGTWLQVDQATVEDKSIWFADQGKITRQKILDQCQCTNILVTSGQNQCQSCPQKSLLEQTQSGMSWFQGLESKHNQQGEMEMLILSMLSSFSNSIELLYCDDVSISYTTYGVHLFRVGFGSTLISAWVQVQLTKPSHRRATLWSARWWAACVCNPPGGRGSALSSGQWRS